MAIGVFWTRLGTPTGEAESGSAEEIRRVADAGKPVMLYFSRGKVDLQATDLDEYARLVSFKDNLYQKALIESYSTLNEFRETLTRQLALRVRDIITEDSSSQTASSIESDIDKISLAIAAGNSAPGSKVPTPFTPTGSVELTAPAIADQDKIPDYKSPPAIINNTGTSLVAYAGDYTNRGYYRDLVNYFREYNLRRYLWLAVVNSSEKSARDIHLDIRIYTSNDGIVVGPQELQVPSSTTFNGVVSYFPAPSLEATQNSRGVTIKNTANNEWRAEIDIPIVQAHRTVVAPAPILLRATVDGNVKFEATTYSSDSPPFSLSTELKVSMNASEEHYRDVLKQLIPEYNE